MSSLLKTPFLKKSEKIQAQESNSQPQVLDLVFQKTKGKGLKYQKINKEKTKILRNIFHEVKPHFLIFFRSYIMVVITWRFFFYSRMRSFNSGSEKAIP